MLLTLLLMSQIVPMTKDGQPGFWVPRAELRRLVEVDNLYAPTATLSAARAAENDALRLELAAVRQEVAALRRESTARQEESIARRQESEALRAESAALRTTLADESSARWSCEAKAAAAPWLWSAGGFLLCSVAVYGAGQLK